MQKYSFRGSILVLLKTKFAGFFQANCKSVRNRKTERVNGNDQSCVQDIVQKLGELLILILPNTCDYSL